MLYFEQLLVVKVIYDVYDATAYEVTCVHVLPFLVPLHMNKHLMSFVNYAVDACNSGRFGILFSGSPCTIFNICPCICLILC